MRKYNKYKAIRQELELWDFDWTDIKYILKKMNMGEEDFEVRNFVFIHPDEMMYMEPLPYSWDRQIDVGDYYVFYKRGTYWRHND